MKALVTGGAGFMGSHVVDCLVNSGHDVYVLDDLSGGFSSNVNPKVTFSVNSITDPNFHLEDVFDYYKFDCVYHLAAYAAEGLSHFIRMFNYKNNLLGSMRLINAAVNYGVKCFVFTSSIAVYGSVQTPMNEETTPQPEDPYGISKLAVELDLKAAHEMFGLDYVIFRPHNVYGERQNLGDPYRNVIGIFMNKIMKGESLPVFGDGRQTRAFTHISDVAPAIADAPSVVEARNQIFNIGSDTPYKVYKLAHMVYEAMGATTTHINFLPARNEVVHAFSNHKKFQRVFGKRHTLSLPEGLRRMANWAKELGPRAGKRFENIEIEKNLPESWRKRD